MSQEASKVNLPKTDFPMRGDLVKREPKRIEHWKNIGLYEKIQTRRAGKEKFVLHDGPPFTNGDVHIGTALNKILKDAILRYKTLRGYATPYIPGWDCHGLPIEHKVTKMLREQGRNLTISQLRQECANFSKSFIEKQTAQFVRLGVLADWKNEYRTMNPAYEAEIMRTFAAFIKRGLVYRSKKPVYWSIPCATALAEAEIEYKDHTSDSIWVAFKILEEDAGKFNLPKDAELVIWTTTPWTMPANLAIALHPDFDYALVETAEGRKFIVCEALAETFAGDVGLEGVKISKLGRGKNFEGLRTKHPFIDRISPVINAQYVTTDSGTGCVHIAPGHGLEDYVAGLQYGLDIYCPLDDQGRYVKDEWMPDELVGITVLEKGGRNEANEKVLDMLRRSGALLGSRKITHQYPHCWRSKTPVIFRAMDQWFVALDKDGFRKEALGAIDTVKWIPERGSNRIRGAVESRPDWCISRQRAWGVPIPAFFDKNNVSHIDAEVALKIADKIEKFGSGFWYDASEAEILDGIDVPAEWGDKSKLRKGLDTLDVWIDSGSSHMAVLAKNPDLKHPADLYFEGSDQHRGWFQSSLWTSVATTGHAPYKSVITHGFIVDQQRRKISKSDGKPQTADMYVNKYGADIIRLWICSEDYQNDIPISEDILGHVANTYRSVRNTLMYQLGNLSDFDASKDAVEYSQMDAIDKWALHKAGIFAEEAKAAYEGYEFHKVYKLIDIFCGVTLSRIYHDILKDRLYTLAPSDRIRRSSQTAMNVINDILMKVISPILTFTADEAYSFKHGGEYIEDSIHLQDWPDVDPNWQHDETYGKIERLLQIREQTNEALEKLRKDKVIGKSLEAELELAVKKDSNDAKILSEFADKLAEIFIVSGVSVVETDSDADISVSARKAEGKKCARCWRMVPQTDENGFCPRCAEALKSYK